MKSQCFLSSYAPDFCWLAPCLRSLRFFSRDFLPPVICVDSADAEACAALVADCYPEALVAIKDTKQGQGFMRAQVAMMQADIYCPEADNIFFLGSDCLAVAEFRPEPYFAPDGRPAVLMSSYESLTGRHDGVMHWRAGVERVLGFSPDYEYMRRIPSVFPRAIFPAMRQHVEQLHRMPFDDYIHLGDRGLKNTSEANLLGAYAHRFMPQTCEWVDIGPEGVDNQPVPGWPSAIVQLWSWGGFDMPTDRRSEIDGQSIFGRTASEIIAQVYRKIGHA